MLSLSRWQVRLGLGLIATIGVLLLSFGPPGGGAGSAHAGDLPGPNCMYTGPAQTLCISLDPATDTNNVGEEHSLTATLTGEFKGQPIPPEQLDGIPIVIVVFNGPDVGTSIIADSDMNGQVTLTYLGDGGPGTDSIAGLACLDLVQPAGGIGVQGGQACLLTGFIDYCVGNPVACLADITEPDVICAQDFASICDAAEKVWVGPTATATPTTAATPTSTPTGEAVPSPTEDVAADIIAPATGAGTATGGSPLMAWLAALVGAIAGVSAASVWLARRGRPTA